MLRHLRTCIYENARCLRHNFLHLKVFRLHYAKGFWHVNDGQVHTKFTHYPFLDFFDIEGYLFDGRWKPNPGDMVIDAGGCYGEFAIYAALRVGSKGRGVDGGTRSREYCGR